MKERCVTIIIEFDVHSTVGAMESVSVTPVQNSAVKWSQKKRKELVQLYYWLRVILKQPKF